MTNIQKEKNYSSAVNNFLFFKESLLIRTYALEIRNMTVTKYIVLSSLLIYSIYAYFEHLNHFEFESMLKVKEPQV